MRELNGRSTSEPLAESLPLAGSDGPMA